MTTMAPVLLCALLVQAPAAETRPATLSPEQTAQLRTLMRETEQQSAALRAELDEAQRQLTEAYASFDLDDERITALEDRIGELQRELLRNYRRLQVGLRQTVGPERFRMLQARLRPFLQSIAAPGRKDSGPKKPAGANDKGRHGNDE